MYLRQNLRGAMLSIWTLDCCQSFIKLWSHLCLIKQKTPGAILHFDNVVFIVLCLEKAVTAASFKETKQCAKKLEQKAKQTGVQGQKKKYYNFKIVFTPDVWQSNLTGVPSDLFGYPNPQCAMYGFYGNTEKTILITLFCTRERRVGTRKLSRRCHLCL